MAIDSTPWLIGVEGVEHSAEVARALAYAATGGNNGIISAGDFKVVPYSTPGGGVRIMPGVAALVNTYSSDSKQSYIGRSGTTSYLSIDPTTSSGGRSDLVVATIRDPQQASYGDWNESLLNNYDYFRFAVVKGVSPITKYYTPTYPCVPLARIDIPASTATITSDMIVDIRAMTQTRTDNQTRVIFPGADTNMAVSQYAHYPQGVTVTWEVPIWATKAVIKTFYSGIEATGGSTTNSRAGFRGVLGQVIDAQNTILMCPQGQRITHVHTAVFDVPEGYRGKPIAYATQGWHNQGTGALQLDYQSTITYEAFFTEGPI